MRPGLALVLGLAAFSIGASAARAAAPPEVPAAWVTDVTATSANLHATIQPNGLNTTYRFEYLTEAEFEAKGWSAASLAPPSGKAPYGSVAGVPAFQHLEHLLPATTYRYRALATNELGSGASPEHLLDTEALSTVPPACPNDGFRHGPGAGLPDCRAYELVSPLDKGGGAIAAPESLFGGGQLQAAPSGSAAITYGSATAFGDAAGAPPVSQYLSTRTDSGWSTENVSAPLASASYGDHPDGAPYRLFSTDLSTGLLFGGEPCRTALPACPFPTPVLPATGAPPGYQAYYLRREPGGAFASLLGAVDVAHSAVAPEAFRVSFAAADPDLSHIVLSSCAALSADAVEVSNGEGGCQAAATNVYLWSGGGLAALNLLPGQNATTPGAALAAPLGAVSEDGARIYFTTLEDGPLYLREAPVGLTKLLPGSVGGPASFQTASADGSVAFFLKGGTLYRYSAVADESDPIAAGVVGVLGASADGTYLYYQDAAGLQRWHQGTVTEVAPGPDAALPSDYPPAIATARVSADGLHLAFLSAALIPPFDNLDADSEAPDVELYLYGPPPGGGDPVLLCASCNPTGERPRGSASIPGTLRNGSTAAYRPRVLSADARRLFFDSADRLVVADTDSSRDVYQWEAQGKGGCIKLNGCLALISGGRTDSARFLDASFDGEDVYFLTAASLLERDPGSLDIYDARAGGGLPEPDQPIPCLGDACQALPPPPDDPGPGTAVPNSGNPPPRYYKQRHKHRRHRHRRHRHHARGPR